MRLFLPVPGDDCHRNRRAARVTACLASGRLVQIGTFALLVAAATATAQTRTGIANPLASRPVGRWQDVSLEDYRKHLVFLEGLTQSCAQARDLKTCDPTLVGPDDRVPLGNNPRAERRMVRYGWLRILFSHAEEPDKAQQAPDSRIPASPARDKTRADAPTTSQLLLDAEKRLTRDLAQANIPSVPTPPHDLARETMKQVLAGREFQNLQQAKESDTALEKFGNWLNRVFARIDKWRAHSAWVARTITWGFFFAIGMGLIWTLLRMEKRWRVRLIPLRERPAPEAASARDWQLWLADAHQAAASELWREALHFVYWASISRLEGKRLWPADRARTPREYLSLMAPNDPRRPGLSALTQSFELTWYGGRRTSESDYRRAEALASALITGGHATVPSLPANQQAPAQGGAA
jgi:hypothetical protein